MKLMSLDDLINLMWSVLEVEKGGPVFFEKLETEIAKRIRGIKDEQYETLMMCFGGDKSQVAVSKFSKKFLDLTIRIILDKKDRFSLSTIVNLVWNCAKIDFQHQNEAICELMKGLVIYERLITSLPQL